MDAPDALAVIADVRKIEELTDWERRFLASLEAQLERKPALTGPQTRTLTGIAKKYGVAFGLSTDDEDALWR